MCSNLDTSSTHSPLLGVQALTLFLQAVPISLVLRSLANILYSPITCYRVQMPQSVRRITPSVGRTTPRTTTSASCRAVQLPKSVSASKPTPSKRKYQSDPGYMIVPSKRRAPEDLIEEIGDKRVRVGKSPLYNKYGWCIKKQWREPETNMPDAEPAPNKIKPKINRLKRHSPKSPRFNKYGGSTKKPWREPEIDMPDADPAPKKIEPKVNKLKRQAPKGWIQTVTKHRRTTQSFETHVVDRFGIHRRISSGTDEVDSGCDDMDLDIKIGGRKRRRHAPTMSSRRWRFLRNRADIHGLETKSSNMDLDPDALDPWLRMVEKEKARAGRVRLTTVAQAQDSPLA